MKSRLLNTDRYFFNLPGTWTPHNVLQCILVSKRMALGYHFVQNNPSFKTWVCSSTSSFSSKNMIPLRGWHRMLLFFFPIQCRMIVWVLLKKCIFYIDIRLQHRRCCKVCNHPGQNHWELCWFVLWKAPVSLRKSALRTTCTVIQGPPGTGKTHVTWQPQPLDLPVSEVLEPQKNHQNEIKHVQASKQLQVRQIVWHTMTYHDIPNMRRLDNIFNTTCK